MEKRAAFTICANNYLAHAAILADSFKKNNPTVDLYIIVADEKCADVSYERFHADKIVFINEIISERDLEGLSQKFNITEFCTAIKPDVLLYLKKLGYSFGVYLDPDLEFFYTLKYVFDMLRNHAIILTPHICSPKNKESIPNDFILLRTGVYNLGFVGFNLDLTERFILWWKERVREYGYHKVSNGMFFDQIWMSYAPAFVDSTYVLRELGYNVANWNLHERRLLYSDDVYFINDLNTRLIFFHYSHFKIDDLPRLARYNDDYTIDNREDIRHLFLSYKSKLEGNGIANLQNINYAYGKRISTRRKFGKSGRFLKKAARLLVP